MLEAQLLNGGAPVEHKKTYAPVEEKQEPVAVVEQQQPIAATPVAPAPLVQQPTVVDPSIVVKIKPKNTTIEITFKADEPKGTFTIKLPTVDTTVTEDSITAIILPEVDIMPPTLVPLTIKINSDMYDVIYAGATCTLNTLRFMSFVRIQKD